MRYLTERFDQFFEHNTTDLYVIFPHNLWCK